MLTENLKLSKDIKELNTRLTEERKKKSTPSSFSRGPEKENSFYEDKIDDLQVFEFVYISQKKTFYNRDHLINDLIQI